MASFKSFLSAVGSDIKKVFAYIASPAGQKIITVGEDIAITLAPGIGGLVSLVNIAINEAIKIEAIAVGAEQQSGSGPQKLAALIAALTPEALRFAADNKLPAPNADQIQNIANSVVSILNTFGAPQTAA